MARLGRVAHDGSEGVDFSAFSYLSSGNGCSISLSRFEYPRMFRPGESLSRARMSAWLNRSSSRGAVARDSGRSDQDNRRQHTLTNDRARHAPAVKPPTSDARPHVVTRTNSS